MLKGHRGQGPFEFEQTFMFYLPRICEHCLNPLVRGVVPVGRDVQSAPRTASSSSTRTAAAAGGCACPDVPYKKVYFNHKTGKAEKCTFCYPRIEVGMPTVCSETCVGRLRYLGLVLYDVDRVLAASVVDEHQGSV